MNEYRSAMNTIYLMTQRPLITQSGMIRVLIEIRELAKKTMEEDDDRLQSSQEFGDGKTPKD